MPGYRPPRPLARAGREMRGSPLRIREARECEFRLRRNTTACDTRCATKSFICLLALNRGQSTKSGLSLGTSTKPTGSAAFTQHMNCLANSKSWFTRAPRPPNSEANTSGGVRAALPKYEKRLPTNTRACLVSCSFKESLRWKQFLCCIQEPSDDRL